MITQEQKDAIKVKNRKSSRRQDLKQHCQKILDGIGRFDDNTASRAIWELLQNARDLSEHAHVKIVLDDDKLVFSHNGVPFNYDTFTSLIKQVSSEEKEDPNAAGQFGTGFMTTHKFSRNIQIDGCMEIAENEYAPINGFKLDRTAIEIQEMIDAMERQLTYADDLIEMPTVPSPTSKTTFTYYLDANRFKAAKQGVDNAIDLLPYVMTINNRIEQVEVCGTQVAKPVKMVKESSRPIDEDTNLYEITICTNGIDRKKIYYLQLEDRKDIVILPLKSEFLAEGLGDIPRFFIYFPLLGTETFGLNYIFHSERFYPEEPRNAIVLPEDNIDKKLKFDTNVKVLDEMTAMLFRYLDKYGDKITDARHLAKVDIDEHENSHQLTGDFYKGIRQKYITKLQSVPFLCVDGERVAVSQNDKVRFLAPDIVEFLTTEEGKGYLDVVYQYASQVAHLPQKDECLEWSGIVGKWDASRTERFITIKDIVDYISEKKDQTQLYDFLRFLKECKQLDNFALACIFPNREGELKSKPMLYDAKDINDVLYNVAKPLIPADTERFVDEKFNDLFESNKLNKYGRDDLKKSINDYVNGQKDLPEPFKETLPALLDYCSVFPVQNGTSIRNNAMPYFCELFDNPYKSQYVAPLPNVEADKEQYLYRTAFDVLVEYTLKYIEVTAKKTTGWFGSNSNLHYNLLNALSNKERKTTYQTESFGKYDIMPDQDGGLHKVSDLKVLSVTDNMTAEVKNLLYDIYKKVYNESLGSKLVDDKYAWMCAFDGLDPHNVCRYIDDSLSKEDYQNNVFIEIVDLLDNDKEDGLWRSWFKNIDDNKANIFLSRLKGAERACTYKFIKADPNRKKKLLELMDRPDFDSLIKKAEDYVKNETEKKIVFYHMLSIGKEIEKKLFAALDQSLLKVEYEKEFKDIKPNDEQDGQDIVVRYNGKEIYYIEVKSKWNFDEPAHMSVNQMRKAVQNPDNYALCCVELTKYNSNEVENISTETILANCYDHLDIGEKLSKLLKPIVDDNSDAEMNIKIYDYKCNLNKGFFVSTQDKGIQPLIDAIVKAVNKEL